MPVIKYRVTLTKDERETLQGIISRGNHVARRFINALILLNCDHGEFQTERLSDPQIEKLLKVSNPRIWRIKRDFIEYGLDMALVGRCKGNPRINKKIDGDVEAHIIALSCSKPPEGYSQWSIRLLTSKIIELNYVDSVSHMTVQRTLKKMSLNLGRMYNG